MRLDRLDREDLWHDTQQSASRCIRNWAARGVASCPPGCEITYRLLLLLLLLPLLLRPRMRVMVNG